jgi:hypothetical protein
MMTNVIVEYKLVTGTNTRVEKQVNDLLDENFGWEPHGIPTRFGKERRGGVWYATVVQAMVRRGTRQL